MVNLACEFCESFLVEVCDGNLKACIRCGGISHLHRRTTVTYDAAYIAERYDQYSQNGGMSRLRLYILDRVFMLCDSCTFDTPPRVLDVGPGNGSFIRECNRLGWDAYGYDVNPTPYEGVRRVGLPLNPMTNPYHLITFYDSLEHFEDVGILRPLIRNTDWIVVSAPFPPADFPENLDWRHYRPGEHHHYLTPRSLEALFQTEDRYCEMVYMDFPEDRIRGKLANGKDNIFTVALRCRDR